MVRDATRLRPVFMLAAGAAILVALAGSIDLSTDDLSQASGHAATVDVVDGPPSYRDQTTMSPVTVVSAGDTVRWEWQGGLSHSVTSGLSSFTAPDGEFDSGTQRLDGNGDPFEFEHTFTEPGTYKYYCQVHALNQHGTVVVLP